MDTLYLTSPRSASGALPHRRLCAVAVDGYGGREEVAYRFVGVNPT
jgi:hypothetical protein